MREGSEPTEMSEVGEMEPVPPEGFWDNEVGFTRWLAKNLHLLGESLGLKLQHGRIEVPVPPHNAFRADILAKTKSGEVVVIENQLKETDHGHLGQLITYAAGFDARILIWVIVAPDIKEWYDNHRIAVDWLNRWTSDELEIYAVAARRITAGESSPAVEFCPVVFERAWQKRLMRRKGPTTE